MSYILDALKRADTERERERGTVPGLHSQNLPSGHSQRDQQRQPAGLPRYAIWAGLLVLIVAAGWYFWLAKESQTDTATAPASTPEPAPAPSLRTTEEPVSVPASAELATARTPDLPILAPPPPAPPPPARAERPQASSPAAASTMEATPSTSAPAPAAAPTTTAAPAPAQPATPVRRFAELSPEIRAQLPQVNVSGSTYSSNPKLRTLIANGKVIQEGDEIAPGLQVETIGQRSAVLNFQGTRYSIGF